MRLLKIAVPFAGGAFFGLISPERAIAQNLFSVIQAAMALKSTVHPTQLNLLPL